MHRVFDAMHFPPFRSGRHAARGRHADLRRTPDRYHHATL